MFLRHLRVADGQAPTARLIDQRPRLVTRRVLEGRSAGAAAQWLRVVARLGDATSSDIEELGEEVRRRVCAKTNISLEWEIQRVGVNL